MLPVGRSRRHHDIRGFIMSQRFAQIHLVLRPSPRHWAVLKQRRCLTCSFGPLAPGREPPCGLDLGVFQGVGRFAPDPGEEPLMLICFLARHG